MGWRADFFLLFFEELSYVCSEDTRINTKSLLWSAKKDTEKLISICDLEWHTAVGLQRRTSVLQNQRDFMKEISGFEVNKGIVGFNEAR